MLLANKIFFDSCPGTNNSPLLPIVLWRKEVNKVKDYEKLTSANICLIFEREITWDLW